MENEIIMERKKYQVSQEDVLRRCDVAGRALVAAPNLTNHPSLAAGFKCERKPKKASEKDQELLGTITRAGTTTVMCGANCLAKLAAGIRKLIS